MITVYLCKKCGGQFEDSNFSRKALCPICRGEQARANGARGGRPKASRDSIQRTRRKKVLEKA